MRVPVRQQRVPVGVKVAHVLELPGLAQPVAGVLAQCLQHPVAGGSRVGPRPHERPLHEPVELLQDRIGTHPGSAADRTGRVDVAARGHDGQPLEHEPLRLLQQPVGPVHCGAERAVALLAASPRAREQIEAVIEMLDDLRR